MVKEKIEQYFATQDPLIFLIKEKNEDDFRPEHTLYSVSSIFHRQNLRFIILGHETANDYPYLRFALGKALQNLPNFLRRLEFLENQSYDVKLIYPDQEEEK